MKSILAFTYKYRFPISLFSLVFGVRMWVFGYAGSPLPFYDQWVFAVQNIFLYPHLFGHAIPWYMFTHNDHRLLTTVFAETVGFRLNGYYDVTWTLCIAAFIRAGTAAFAFQLLSPNTRTQRWLVWSGVVLVFVLPYCGYNALNGMQMCFYLVEFSLLVAIALTLSWPPATIGAPRHFFNWHAFGLAGISLFGLASFTSAVAIPLATLSVHVLQYRRRPGFYFAWLVSLAGAIALVLFAPRSPYEAPTFIAGLKNLPLVLSWPQHSMILGVLLLMVIVALGVFLWTRRANLAVPIVGLTGILVFCIINAFFIALKRGGVSESHFETMLPIPICLIVICFYVSVMVPPVRILMRIVAISLAIVAIGGLVEQGRNTVRYYQVSHQRRIEALLFYRVMLRTGRIQEVGYTTNSYMLRGDYSFFNDPILKYTPGAVVSNNVANNLSVTLAILSPDIILGRNLSAISVCTHALIAIGPLIIVIAHVLLVFSCFILKEPTPLDA